MSIVLKQLTGSTNTATDDAILYDYLAGGDIGVIEGCTITSKGALILHIADGWGIVQGRRYVVTAQDITVTAASSGTASGSLWVKIDTATTNGASFVSYTGSHTPTQEDINGTGTVYEYQLASYTVSTSAVSDLVQSFSPEGIGDRLAKLETRIAALEARQNISMSISGSTLNITST